MNPCLEINPDKHSNLEDFICSLELRCTSEKRFGGRSSRGKRRVTRSLAFICFRSSSCGGGRCVLTVGEAPHSFRGRAGFFSPSFFLFLLYYRPAPNVLALKSKRKLLFSFFALRLAERYLFRACLCATFWGGRRAYLRRGLKTTSLAGSRVARKKTRNKCFMKQTCTSLPCFVFFGNWFAASSCIQAPRFSFLFVLFLIVPCLLNQHFFKKNVIPQM